MEIETKSATLELQNATAKDRRLPVDALLVSVRNVDEFRSVARFGLRWIDVKEPEHGSLGCPSVETIRSILNEYRRFCDERTVHDGSLKILLSIALGNLEDAESLPVEPNLLEPFEMIKVGIADRSRLESLRPRLQRWQSESGCANRFVLVHYPDANSQPLDSFTQLLQIANAHGIRRVLMDTLRKNGQTLLDCLTVEQMRQCVDHASSFGIDLMAAGSLRLDQLHPVWDSGTKIIGIRSAVCERNTRVLAICPDRLTLLGQYVIQTHKD